MLKPKVGYTWVCGLRSTKVSFNCPNCGLEINVYFGKKKEYRDKVCNRCCKVIRIKKPNELYYVRYNISNFWSNVLKYIKKWW